MEACVGCYIEVGRKSCVAFTVMVYSITYADDVVTLGEVSLGSVNEGNGLQRPRERLRLEVIQAVGQAVKDGIAHFIYRIISRVVAVVSVTRS